MWETSLTGYQSGINVTGVIITVNPVTTGLAEAISTGQVIQGGYRVSTTGRIDINVNQIEPFANYQGVGANGLNFIDELLAHETGHVLGVGTLWTGNHVYVNNTFQYTGANGLAAYRGEFNPAANFVPVENAGAEGTMNSHWDQRVRSSTQEGNPADPFSLTPFIGVTDPFGRDFGLELMTGTLDPDYREPFLSRTTIESMRDLGFVATSFYDFNRDNTADVLDLAILTSNLGATGLQIDSVAFGDVDRDRDVDSTDLSLWTSAVPEPGAGLAVTSVAAHLLARRRRTPAAA